MEWEHPPTYSPDSYSFEAHVDLECEGKPIPSVVPRKSENFPTSSVVQALPLRCSPHCHGWDGHTVLSHHLLCGCSTATHPFVVGGREQRPPLAHFVSDLLTWFTPHLLSSLIDSMLSLLCWSNARAVSPQRRNYSLPRRNSCAAAHLPCSSHRPSYCERNARSRTQRWHYFQ